MMAMRSFIPVTLAGLCLVSLSGCMDYSDPNRTNMSRNGPMTTTTTTVVRDANGGALSTTEAVRDANGYPVSYGPGYPVSTYRRY
jgi:hypothetical protein